MQDFDGTVWGWDPVVEIAYYSKHFRPETYKMVVNQERIVGYFSIYAVDEKLLLLEAMVVDVCYQRKGIGTRILSDLIKMANEQLTQLELSIQKNNLTAKKIYERHGFVIFSQSLTHYKMRYNPQKQ